MKAYILVALLIIQITAATLTVDKITEKVHEGLKILKAKAVTKLHKLKQEFDLKKLHQFNAALLPYAHKHYVHEHYSKKTPLVVDHHQIDRLKHYFEPHHKPVHHHHHVEPHLKPPVHIQHFQHFEHLKV